LPGGTGVPPVQTGETPVPPTGWPNPPLVKILDFGLARLAVADPDQPLSGADVLTRERAVFGTPEYMAPEQAKDSRRVDIRSDIYSLGCTLYALLAGRPPFLSRNPSEVLAMHLTQPPDPVSKYRPDVPAWLVQVVDRMLAKQPEDRFATPREVAQALQSAAHPNGVAPTKSSVQPQTGVSFAILFLIFLTVALLGLALLLLF
jgi:serine/threonine-protein kinase